MQLRYFFDWSGDILWAGDDEALKKFGYPVDLDKLPLSDQTKQMVIQLFDDWVKVKDERNLEIDTKEFTLANESLYSRIVHELGSSFEVFKEM